MKVTTERLPKSLIAMDIEPDQKLIEKELDKAARRLSQQVQVPGFRKGKAPRFIIENYYGRAAILDEATDEIINAAFKEALSQEGIEPVGKVSLEKVEVDPFSFRVLVPVDPTITLPDYRAIRVEQEREAVTEERVDQAMEMLRDRHVVLQELDAPRPAEPGDQVTAIVETWDGDEHLDAPEEGQEPEPQELVLEENRLLPELYEGLLGVEVGETREITARVPETNRDERVAGKEVRFKITANAIQQRLLPEWEELPTLQDFDGSLDELRVDVRRRLEDVVNDQYRTDTINSYMKQLIEQTEFEIPDAMVESQADMMLHRQEAELKRYGISLDQWLQYRGMSHDDAVKELMPQAEEELKSVLALRELLKREDLSADEDEIDAEIERLLADVAEDERENARNSVVKQASFRERIANNLIDRKLHDRIVAIASGQELSEAAATAEE